MKKAPASQAQRQRTVIGLTARARALAAVALLVLSSSLMLSGSDHALPLQPDSQQAAGSPAGSQGYVPGQVLVRFREGVGPARRSELGSRARARRTLARLGAKGRKDIHLIQLEAGMSVESAVASFRDSSDVVSAEPNYIRHATQIPTPNDPLFANQWGLHNTGQLIGGITGQVDADIDAEVAWWSSEKGNSNPVTVAVIDTGIDQNHPDLVNSLWQNAGEIPDNGLDDDANGYVDDVIGYNMAGISQTHINAMWAVGKADTNWRGQSITGTGGPLTEVSLYIGPVGTPTASIEVVVRESLTGSDLATATILASDVGAADGVVRATLSPSVALAAKTYYILFRTTTANASNHYNVYGNASTLTDYRPDPYRGGMQHFWNGSAWTSGANDDWYFTTNANANPQDDQGHGTHVSGIIGAGIDNGVGIAGVSYGARIMTLKAGDSSGSFTSSDIIEALHYAADNGAKVINMSFGGDTFSSLERDAVLYAYGRGAALFAAAGNDGTNTFSFPASYSRVVSVAATTNRDTRASFSNYNASVDVAAPGENIYSTMPTYAVGLNSAGAAQDYEYLSGTSMASPMAAGMAALVLSRNPDYTAEAVMWVVENRLLDDKGAPGWDQLFGNGRITGVLLANEVPVGNNRIDGAWWVSASPFGETLDSGGDRNDIFSVAVAAGQRIKVRMEAPSGTDFDLYLHPPGTTDGGMSAGSAVASSAGGTYPEAFSYVAPPSAGGTYYLQVNAKSGRGSYTITYSVMDADNGIPGVPIPPSPISDSLQFYFDDDDVFSVSLADGQQIVASLTGQAGTDFDLYLYPPGSTDFSSAPVAVAAGGAYPEKINFIVPAGAGGTYYVRAAYPGYTLGGTYTLTYSIGAADVTPPVTAALAAPILPDGTNGWYKTAPTIALASNEAGITFFQWDGPSNGWWQSYAGPFGAPEGAHMLYYYSVDAVGNAEPVQQRMVKTDLGAPSAPVLSASADSSTAVTLSWGAATDAVSGISGYRVYDADSPAPPLGSTSAVSYQLTGLTPGVQNRYYVTAVDNAGHESSPGNTVTIATLAAGLGVSATVNSVTLTFSSIVTEGGVTVSTSTTPPATQTGFQLNGVYYDVSTTAGYAGLITVTVPYDPATAGDPQALRLFHYDKNLNSWIDVTIGVDTANHTVSGRVSSFSWFGAGSPRQVFGGFERPIDASGTLVTNQGQTLPVKFRVMEPGGLPVTDAVARIYVAGVVNGVPGTEMPATSTNREPDNTARYSESDGLYIFNLETGNLSPGVWQIRVLLDDGLSYVALVSVGSKGGK